MGNGCSTLRTFPAVPRILRSTECIWVSGATSRCVLQGPFLFFFFFYPWPLYLWSQSSPLTAVARLSSSVFIQLMFYSLAPLSLSFFSFSFILSHHLFFSPCVCLCQHPYSVLTRSSPYCFLFCVYILLTVAFSSTFFFVCVCVFAFSLLLYISGFFFFSIPNPTHGQLSVVSFFFFFLPSPF